MYTETIQAMGEQAATKLANQRRSLIGHMVRSMLAGMYVGAAIVLIFTIGGSLAKDSPGAVKLVMGVCFGGALTMVIFAGSELFTGSNLVLTLGVLTGKARISDLGANWLWTWIGNLMGSALLAGIVIRSGIFDGEKMEAVRTFILNLVQTKMTLAPEPLFWRAVLANWLVCLGVWMAARAKEEIARILLIWWCMFTFITCGYEHSIANMCGLLLGLFLPHESFPGITWSGYGYNLALATLGNVVGGALFVAGMYWLGSPKARDLARPAVSSDEQANGVMETAVLTGAPR
jgi:nitrite transporter NirC